MTINAVFRAAHALPVTTGLLLLLAYPPYDRATLAWVALVPLLWRALAHGAGRDGREGRRGVVVPSLAGGFLWGAGLFYPLLWIEEGEWFQRAGGFLILCLLTASMLGLFGAASCGIDRALARRWRWLLTLVLPSVWVVQEYVIRTIAAGFSTYLGVTQWRFPAVLAVASVGGVYAVSWTIVAVNTALALAAGRVVGAETRGATASAGRPPNLAARGSQGIGLETAHRPAGAGRWLPVLLGAAALVALITGGSVGPTRVGPKTPMGSAAPVGSSSALGSSGSPEDGSLLRLMLVQPNITPAEYAAARTGIDAQRRLWGRVLVQADQAVMTALGATGERAPRKEPEPIETLVVLPETFVHYWASDDPAFRGRFSGFAKERGVHWLVGLPQRVERPDINGARSGTGATAFEQRNTVLVIDGDGTVRSVYDKIHVIPIAEAHFAPGSELGLLPLGEHVLGIGICSDVVVPDHALATVRAGATSLHYVASLAHIGAIAELERAFVVFRAAEHRVFVTQTATTGPTLVVDPRGRIVQEAAQGQPGTVIVDMEPRRLPPAPYTRFGDWVVLASAVIAIGHGLLGRGRLVPAKASGLRSDREARHERI